jgi:hypothetical protein
MPLSSRRLAPKGMRGPGMRGAKAPRLFSLLGAVMSETCLRHDAPRAQMPEAADTCDGGALKARNRRCRLPADSGRPGASVVTLVSLATSHRSPPPKLETVSSSSPEGRDGESVRERGEAGDFFARSWSRVKQFRSNHLQETRPVLRPSWRRVMITVF